MWMGRVIITKKKIIERRKVGSGNNERELIKVSRNIIITLEGV